MKWNFAFVVQFESQYYRLSLNKLIKLLKINKYGKLCKNEPTKPLTK